MTANLKQSSHVPGRLLHVVVEFSLFDAGRFRVHDDLLDDKAETGQNGRFVVTLGTVLPNGGRVQGVHPVHQTDLYTIMKSK